MPEPESPTRAPAPPPCTASPVPTPLPYTVRVCARAKRLTLRVTPGRGLLVTVPRRFATRDVAPFVESNRAWIEARLAEQARRTPAVCLAWPPRTLELAAVGRSVTITASASGAAHAAPAPSPARWRDERTLELPFALPLEEGTAEDRVRLASAIAAALQGEGRRLLVPRLHALAERHALAFARVAVRGQRTVWGSCSSRGTVSLNWKLLFLRPALVDYVLLHELAHTRHLDHSAAFWRLLVALEPEARALDGELRSAGRLVPPWLELARNR